MLTCTTASSRPCDHAGLTQGLRFEACTQLDPSKYLAVNLCAQSNAAQIAELGHSSQDESILRSAASTAALRLARRHDKALPAETYLRLALAMQVQSLLMMLEDSMCGMFLLCAAS